jgi:general secretion pathway protein A
VVITGEEGSGKTLLVDTFRRELDKSIVVAYLTQAPFPPMSSCRRSWISSASSVSQQSTTLLGTLNGYLAEQHAAGRKVLLLIDEAQDLAPLLDNCRPCWTCRPAKTVRCA